MIRIEAVRAVPADIISTLTPNSSRDYEFARHEPLHGDMWAVYDDDIPLIFFRVHRTALLGSAEFTFMICQGYTAKYLRETRTRVRLLAEMSRGLITAIRCDYETGKKFAEFMGFRPLALSTAEFTLYEMRA